MATIQRLNRFNSRWELSNDFATTGCWNWKSPASTGYGRFYADKKNWPAHRWIYNELIGDTPSGMVVRHKCDNKRCVNPLHLELGTYAENAKDAVDRGILPVGDDWHKVKRNLPSGEVHGKAKLTDAQVDEIRNSDLTAYRLGKIYGVSATHIRRIKRKESR